MITQEELKQFVTYDPETGIFKSRVNNGRRRYVGEKLGWLTDYGYLRCKISDSIYYLHRMAFLYMTGEIPPYVDHINHIRTDNRWINLRAADRTINGKNQSRHARNASGVMGVLFNKKYGCWGALISVNRKNIWLGTYYDLFSAVCARKSAELKYGFHENHGRDKRFSYHR